MHEFCHEFPNVTVSVSLRLFDYEPSSCSVIIKLGFLVQINPLSLQFCFAQYLFILWPGLMPYIVERGCACTNQTAWCQNPEDHGISLNVVENLTLHAFLSFPRDWSFHTVQSIFFCSWHCSSRTSYLEDLGFKPE